MACKFCSKDTRSIGTDICHTCYDYLKTCSAMTTRYLVETYNAPTKYMRVENLAIIKHVLKGRGVEV